MSKFTPGPWTATEPMQVVMSKMGPVASGYGKDVFEARANARLIASAPMMLEALKMALEEIKAAWPQLGPCERILATSITSEIEPAIAKAEGKAP